MDYLYIIYSETFAKFYIGISNDPWIRLEQHNSSDRATFTAKYRPWILKAAFKVSSGEYTAEYLERFIKKQKSRALIDKLIDQTFEPQGKLAQLVRVPHLRD